MEVLFVGETSTESSSDFKMKGIPSRNHAPSIKAMTLLFRWIRVVFTGIGNAVIDMYAKCGCMEDACLCFRNMTSKNAVSWTALIAGYGKQGQGIEALKVFDAMEIEGVRPNKITFLGALYACSHAGLVQEGRRVFNTMAYNFIGRIPIKPDSKLLTAFLSSCCSHKNLELGKSVGKKLLESEPDEAGAYMLLFNFYGLVGDWQVVAKTKKEIVLGHSEKLAIGLGVISTPAVPSIVIVKNLRMCADCHVATGLISKIEGREIVARDSSRFHHFKDGLCSCGNHW
ncbi:hypothetical protein M0R45_017555 [Rubus argutus]|uniref:DYW domain-containing protein n=1 Tax=Rubus argutus TaxID=59490 RepID=A0AAW1XZE2_RUBAR